MLLGLALAVVVGLYSWGAHFWLDPVDEGYFVYTSSRVLAGELPYRDFATPYTPGFFYWNAALLEVFGRDVLPIRISLCFVRGGVLLLLYLLGRRIMRPAFAVVPLFVFIGQDHGPTLLEVHPAWYALLFSLLAVWCSVRALEQPRGGWLLAAGLAAGASFAFKQNAGLFTLLALYGLLLLERSGSMGDLPPRWLAAWRRVPPRASDTLLRLAPAGYFLVLLAAVSMVTVPHLELVPAVLLLAPLIALTGLLTVQHLATARAAPPAEPSAELAALIWRLLLVSLGFAVLTLLWLLPLLLALGPAQTPLALFLGSVDQGGYFLPLRPLGRSGLLLPVVLSLGPLALWRIGRAGSPRRRVLEGALTLAAAALLADLVVDDVLANYRAPALDPAWLAVDITSGLVLYLPALAFWPAFALLALQALPRQQMRYLRWYLLAGSLLLLKQYPRMDETHLIFAGPLLWIPGAYALRRLYTRLLTSAPRLSDRSLGRALAFATLLSLPLAAVWPSIVARLDEISGREAGGIPVGERSFVRVGLPGASVMAEAVHVQQLRSVVGRIQARSRPGERIFVYPAAPLLYYLADRPNATRFNHVFPGLLSADDELEAVAALAQRPAVLVVWDAPGALAWQSGDANRRLTDFIWERYAAESEVANYVVMVPREGALSRAVLPP